MSGSPVFIDGKLIGAVAYGFPFSKETIGGITPIGEMIELTDSAIGRRAPRPPRFAPRRAARAGPKAPLDRDALMAALRRPLPAVRLAPGALRGDAAARSSRASRSRRSPCRSSSPASTPPPSNGRAASSPAWASRR